MTVYCPVNREIAEYNNRVMRLRCHGFAKQKRIDEFTVLVNPLGIDDAPMDYVARMIRRCSADRITLVTAPGLTDPGSGILQFLVDTSCDWVYFNEDAHCLPLHASSVARPVELIEANLPECDVVLDSDGRTQERHCPKYTRLPQGLPVTKNHEWGFWQRRSSLGRHFRVPSSRRNFDAAVFAYQGARVGCSQIHSVYFMHHHIDGSPSSLEVFDEEDIAFTMFEPGRVLPDFSRTVETVSRSHYQQFDFNVEVFSR